MTPMSAPADLAAVFDHFVADMSAFTDPAMMETAGAQCLVLAGFFEDQMMYQLMQRQCLPNKSPYFQLHPIDPMMPEFLLDTR